MVGGEKIRVYRENISRGVAEKCRHAKSEKKTEICRSYKILRSLDINKASQPFDHWETTPLDQIRTTIRNN